MRGRRSTDRLHFWNTADNVGPFMSQIFEISHVNPIDYFMQRGVCGVVGLRYPSSGTNTLCWSTLVHSVGAKTHSQTNILVILKSCWGEDPEGNINCRDNGGYITFGGANPTHWEGEHIYYDVEDISEWKIRMTSVVVEGNHRLLCNKALIHTGTPYIYGPPVSVLFYLLC